MNEFILKKERYQYYLFCGDNLISCARFDTDRQAVEYYRNFISSFPQSTLTLRGISCN
jgi:hypothetical protein